MSTITENPLNEVIWKSIHSMEKEVSDLHTLNKLFKGAYKSRIETAEKRLQWWYKQLDE